MTLLDQLFGTDTKTNIGRELTSAAKTQTATAASIAHAINGGFSPGQIVPGQLDEITSGTVDFSPIDNRVNFFTSFLSALDDQTSPPAQKDTADYVFSGGIKRGTRCIIQLEKMNASVKSSSVKNLLTKNTYRGARSALVFDKFSVESINEPDEEKYQIFETMSADVLYAFNRRYRIFMLSGSVLNGRFDHVVNGEVFSMDWKNAFQRAYSDHFRASRLIREGNKLVISLQDTIYTGFALNLVATTSAANQAISQVTLTFVLKSKTYAGENDDRMPGTLDKKSGLIIPSKKTPEELFPTPKLEEFVQKDAETILRKEIRTVTSEATTLANSFGKMIGAKSDVIDGFRQWINNGAPPSVVSIASGVSGHPVLAWINNTLTDSNSLDETAQLIEDYKLSYISDFFLNPLFTPSVSMSDGSKVNLPIIYIGSPDFQAPQEPSDLESIIARSIVAFDAWPNNKTQAITDIEKAQISFGLESCKNRYKQVKDMESYSLGKLALINEIDKINAKAVQLEGRIKFLINLEARYDQIVTSS